MTDERLILAACVRTATNMTPLIVRGCVQAAHSSKPIEDRERFLNAARDQQRVFGVPGAATAAETARLARPERRCRMSVSLARAIAVRIRLRRRNEDLRLHPAIAGKHVISLTRDCAGSEIISVATCQCSWRSRVEVSEIADQDAAIEGHWRDVIASSRGLAA
jgi:hypothetical protein